MGKDYNQYDDTYIFFDTMLNSKLENWGYAIVMVLIPLAFYYIFKFIKNNKKIIKFFEKK